MSKFSKAHLEEIALALGGLDKNWKKRWLAKKLSELENDIPAFRRGKLSSQPASVRNLLRRLLAACERASPAGERNFETFAKGIIDQSDDARTLILWQMALERDLARPESAIRDTNAQQALDEVLRDPASVRKVAAAALSSIERDVSPGRGGRRHDSNWPLEETILQLGVLFWELTGRTPGISVDANSGKPTGLFLGFLRSCLPTLGWPSLSDEAIRHHARKVREELRKMSGPPPCPRKLI